MSAPRELSPAELTAEIRRISGLVAHLDQAVFTPADDEPNQAASAPQGSPQPVYDNVEAWTNGYFVQVYSRVTGGQWRWCAQWWRHAEAIIRLEALWRTWETMRLDPDTGMATWLRDYLDPQLTALLSPTGPFASCSADRHTEPKPLPTLLADDGWWNV